MSDIPAFPRTGSKDIHGYGVDDQEGMTLRDWFAGLALQGMMASPELLQVVSSKEFGGDGSAPARCARSAYRFADAMLEERIVPDEGPNHE